MGARLRGSSAVWQILLTTVIATAGCTRLQFDLVNEPSDLLAAAESAAQQKDFDAAIARYREHIEHRQRVDHRPEWENPMFYLIFIGDLELQRNDAEAALRVFEEAEANGVSRELIADRFRAVARWYEGRGELRQAFEVLKRYRDRDSLLFDAMLDRVSRRISAEEEK